MNTELPTVIDIDSPSWTRLAYQDLKQWGYARLRLTPPEASLMRDLYVSTDEFFNDRSSTRKLEVPDEAFDDLDERSGYVFDRHREMFEVHCNYPHDQPLRKRTSDTSLSSETRQFLRLIWDVIEMCETRCNEALLDIAGVLNCAPLDELLHGESNRDESGQQPQLDKIVENMLRVYRYAKTYDRPNGDIDMHYDMGLLTLIPRSTSPGLQIRPVNGKESDTFSIEEHLGEDEALLFGGMTLARLTGIPALHHGVFTDGRVRFSAPFFQRVAPPCLLPSSPGHKAERVWAYNRRLRDADNEDLRSDGSIELPRRRRRWRDSRSRSRSRNRRPDNRNASRGSDGNGSDSWKPSNKEKQSWWNWDNQWNKDRFAQNNDWDSKPRSGDRYGKKEDHNGWNRKPPWRRSSHHYN